MDASKCDKASDSVGFHSAYDDQKTWCWEEFSQPSQTQVDTGSSSENTVHGPLLYSLISIFHPAEINKHHSRLHHQDPLLITQQLNGFVPSVGKGLAIVFFSFLFLLFILLLSTPSFEHVRNVT